MEVDFILMAGSVAAAAGILAPTFAFDFTGSASPSMIRIRRIPCWGLLTFTYVNLNVSLFLLCGLKGRGNENVLKSPEWACEDPASSMMRLSGVRVVLFRFNSRSFPEVLNENVEDSKSLFT